MQLKQIGVATVRFVGLIGVLKSILYIAMKNTNNYTHNMKTLTCMLNSEKKTRFDFFM